jgi:hypothetical protein
VAEIEYDVVDVEDEDDSSSLDPALRLDVVKATNHWRGLRALREETQKKEDAAKKVLMEDLDTFGDEDSKGHKILNFHPDEVPGLRGIKRERRVSQILDSDAAMALITSKGLESQCLTTSPSRRLTRMLC